jgi:hypothetical protein
MNQKGKNLFEQALQTTMRFGNNTSPYVVCFENAAIMQTNFEGRDIVVTPKNGGRPFTKQGRRFTLVLTEEMFNALRQEKGDCSHGVWQFDDENPDLKLYTIEVNLKFESKIIPECELWQMKKGRFTRDSRKVLNSTTVGNLDALYQNMAVERTDLVLNPYDPYKSGKFTLWVREIRVAQKEIDDSNSYWNVTIDEVDPNEIFNDMSMDPNLDPDQA